MLAFSPFQFLQIAAGSYNFHTVAAIARVPSDMVTPATFPAIRRLEMYVHPDNGHSLNFHLNATRSYGAIADIFVVKGF